MKVIIIGGGAAGMLAAYQAAKCGNDVSLYEKNEKLGKKIFITGKGRCNVTKTLYSLRHDLTILRPHRHLSHYSGLFL